MFVQIIEGKVSDKVRVTPSDSTAGKPKIRPGAYGFLGSTGGVTDDGVGFAIARFESAAAAQANSERAEQGAWWAETEKCFDGRCRSRTPKMWRSSSAGARTMLIRTGDEVSPGPGRAVVKDLDERFEKHASSWRPDLIGGVRVWTGETSTVEVNYFTSEADARANEAKEPPAELVELFAQYSDVLLTPSTSTCAIPGCTEALNAPRVGGCAMVSPASSDRHRAGSTSSQGAGASLSLVGSRSSSGSPGFATASSGLNNSMNGNSWSSLRLGSGSVVMRLPYSRAPRFEVWECHGRPRVRGWVTHRSRRTRSGGRPELRSWTCRWPTRGPSAPQPNVSLHGVADRATMEANDSSTQATGQWKA